MYVYSQFLYVEYTYTQMYIANAHSVDEEGLVNYTLHIHMYRSGDNTEGVIISQSH